MTRQTPTKADRMSSYPRKVLLDVERASFVSFLDLTRWVAAGIVFVGHLRNPLFLGYADVATADRNILIQLWFFVTGWFGEAVVVFFVLSGYLVGGIASARASVGGFSLVGYSIDRVTRLYMAFLPALLLTAALDIFGSSWFASTGFYTHSHPMLMQKVSGGAFSIYLTPQNFFANALMLQTIAWPTFGSNDPLWTISLEFWFYLVFGLGLAAWLEPVQWKRVLGFCMVALLFLVLGAGFPVFMGLWLLGVIVAFVPWRAVERPLIALGAFVGVLLLTRAEQAYFKGGAFGIALRNYMTALAFAWLLVSMRSIRWAPLERIGRFNKFLADFSYSLYLIHFPLMLFVLGALHATGRFDVIARGYSPASGQGLFVYGTVIVVVYLCAWLFSQVTERQTWRARRALKKVFRTHNSATKGTTFPPISGNQRLD